MNVGVRLADTGFELDDTRRESALVVLVERRNPVEAEDFEGPLLAGALCSVQRVLVVGSLAQLSWIPSRLAAG
jgi:hypothetical protein